MMTSMTGFGRSQLDSPLGQLTVEIQAVNRKFLEVFVSLPKNLSRFEQEVRKWVSSAATRGQVTVRVFLAPKTEHLLPNLQLLKKIQHDWRHVAEQLGYDPASVDLPFLLDHLPEQTEMNSVDDSILSSLQETVQAALQGLLQMKQQEGSALSRDILQRLMIMEKGIAEIEGLSPETVARMRLKLKERIAEVVPNLADEDERLLKEIALIAEKLDITEEITRFRSHLSQFRSVLKEKGASGRKMEFLVQEMGREINTIGSKSMEAKIAHLVVDIKAELEKVREQIQNIE